MLNYVCFTRQENSRTSKWSKATKNLLLRLVVVFLADRLLCNMQLRTIHRDLCSFSVDLSISRHLIHIPQLAAANTDLGVELCK